MKFIDLFAGIGGFHLALSKLGCECVFASEIDKYARDTYKKNFNIKDEIFNNDIRKISPYEIPNHDILCAGFPCQPFSQAGYKRGFSDMENSERGNLFFCIADILKAKRPRAFILENVRYLINHSNGETFRTICDILSNELNYSIFYKVIKASDFGRPQHRPRVYIVGFSNESILNKNPFNFPDPIPLNMTMSDIWEGECNKKIGYTLRVGGKGSPIEDRRNWDGYVVNDKIVRLGPIQAKRMMGFPDNFILSESTTQSMKQLGNSVCVDVVYNVAKQVLNHMSNNEINSIINTFSFNKGEWSELYTFFKIIFDSKIYWHDEYLNIIHINDFVKIFMLKHNNKDIVYTLDNDNLSITSDGQTKNFNINEILPNELIYSIFNEITNNNSTTFDLLTIKDILNIFNIKNFKGSSFYKEDIRVGFNYNNQRYEDQPLGIKSFLGGKPTLLNASSATNFIYKITNFSGSITEINSIETKAKVRDRIKLIEQSGGIFSFYKCDNDTFEYNLNIIDSNMTEIISRILLDYYKGKDSDISLLVKDDVEIIKIKRLLKSILLGMFFTKKWDGENQSNGIIVVKIDGNLALYHVIKEKILNQYLYLNTKLDTPSTNRHRFGFIYEENGEFFFKLNLQIRHK